MTISPVCFVVTPFGQKSDSLGGVIDFDLIYRTLISPAVSDAGMTPLRSDELMSGGPLLQAVLQRVLGAPVAVFDVSTTNANTMYELGIRHALRPQVTLLVAARGTRLPWDLSNLPVIFYELNATGRPENPESFRRVFAEHVRARINSEDIDSPVYHLFTELRPPDLATIAAASQPEQSRQTEELKRRILAARRLGSEELAEIEEELGEISAAAPEVVLTLFDAYRVTGAWRSMIDLVGRMRRSVASTPRVQEQLALALNRIGESQEAEEVLQRLLNTKGATSETYGVLGRIYKDQWAASLNQDDTRRAAAYLRKAIDAYLAGFEADWRDPYQGLNAVTLMTIRQPLDPRRDELLPVVMFAAKRKLESSRADYWDAATLLELAVLAGDEQNARQHLDQVLVEVRDAWQAETTARNLRLIRGALEQRSEGADWIEEIEQELIRVSTT